MNQDWSDTSDLRLRWLELGWRLQAQGDLEARFDQLQQFYRQPVRAYHKLSHIAFCLQEFTRLQIPAAHSPLLEWAIWWHDACYDPRREDNELKSAELAAEAADGLRLGAIFSQHATDLILATRHNRSALNAQEAALMDIDLAILGQDARTFAAYERAIRQEYAFIDDHAFRGGRMEVLQRFLARDRLYATNLFHDLYETAARTNIQRSLKAMQG